MSDRAELSDQPLSGSLNPRVEAPSCLDGCSSPPTAVSPPWQALCASIERLGREELAVRAENIRRILDEHGVSCFVNRNGVGNDEPWTLDLLPLVIGCAEWRELEAGLLQRARLLNLLLGDLYGTQRLVRDGFVPAPLVFANPGYLRACQAIQVKDNAYLQTYAADLARTPDGRWWVLSDRTQAPAGLGFAMENRSVLSRVLPETTRDLQPRPILDTLHIRRDTLRRFAPQSEENPSIVLLTPGQRNEAYFEHAYLSRLLGLTLVESDDLTVRNRRLFIKTLDGLRPADVVLRRVSDSFCDPLELRSDSLLGVPGLVEAARAGHISIGNALGTGLLESPAFMPFLPGLCRHLLDEELRLPSIATWWCGQAKEQTLVRDRLDQLVLRPAFSLGGTPVSTADLDSAQRDELLGQLRLRPHEFVGQEQVPLSREPVWMTSPGRDACPFVLRVFVLHNGTDFTVMPGGLARVVEQDHLCSCPLSLSGLSKDVWVLPDEPAAGPQARIVSPAIPALERVPSVLPSRAADNFFWLSRYAERLEQLVRVMRRVLGCLADDSAALSHRRLAALKGVMEQLGLVSCPTETRETREQLQQEILLLLFEKDRAGGMREILEHIHQAAFSVRDRLSADTWRILNRLEPESRPRAGRLPLVHAAGVLHTLVLDLAAFSGMEMENMTRGHGWVFLNIGRRIERGLFTARLMEAVWRIDENRDLLLEPALEIADSVMTHRRRYFSEPQLASVMEVLVQDSTNPRSLAFQVACLKDHAAALPTGANPEGVVVVQGLANQLNERVRSLQYGSPGDEASELSGAADELAGLVAGLTEFSELLSQVYFSHVTPRVS